MPRRARLADDSTGTAMQRVTFSADDFGLTESVNAAVELAHCEGALTTASLMVAGPAAADASAPILNLSCSRS